MTSPEPDLRTRVEQLEHDRESLYAMFRTVDGEYHEMIARHRADRSLMAALRQTQIEHGQVLGGLVTNVGQLNADVADLKTGVTDLKTGVTDLKIGQSRLESLIRRALNLPDEA